MLSNPPCVSYGVSAGIEDGLCLAAQKRKEVEVFCACSPWLYGGYHNMIKGRPGAGGWMVVASNGSMM